MLALGGAGVAGAALGSHGAEGAADTPEDAAYVLAASAIGGARMSGELARQDITEGKPGVPLTLRLTVREAAGGREPVAGATVEVWHCDALGHYAGRSGASSGRASRETFLRGSQTTGNGGRAEFRTIVPGWYGQRAPHIHVLVHHGEAGGAGAATACHAGQLFLGDEVADEVKALDPYRGHAGDGPVRLAEDAVYSGTSGASGDGAARGGLLTVAPMSPGGGYVGSALLEIGHRQG